MAIQLAIVTVIMDVSSAMSAGDHAGAAAGALAGTIGIRLIGQFVISAVTIWLWLRLSMGPVMSFHQRQFRLFESWALTKGHVWRMFLVMLLVVLILFVIEVVMAIIGIASVAGTIASVPG